MGKIIIFYWNLYFTWERFLYLLFPFKIWDFYRLVGQIVQDVNGMFANALFQFVRREFDRDACVSQVFENDGNCGIGIVGFLRIFTIFAWFSYEPRGQSCEHVELIAWIRGDDEIVPAKIVSCLYSSLKRFRSKSNKNGLPIDWFHF